MRTSVTPELSVTRPISPGQSPIVRSGRPAYLVGTVLAVVVLIAAGSTVATAIPDGLMRLTEHRHERP